MEAAAAVFAETGFRRATIRDICRKAGANVAAVNYHFRDKGGLYRAVLEESYRRSLEKYPPNLGLTKNASPEERLEAFIYSFLLRIFSEGPEACHGKLLAMEMIEPTPTLDVLVENSFRPLAVQLSGIVGEILGKSADPAQVRLCGLSVVGQCVFYHHCKAVTSRLFPDMGFSAAELKNLSRHIAEFSLAGIRGSKKGKGKKA